MADAAGVAVITKVWCAVQESLKALKSQDSAVRDVVG